MNLSNDFIINIHTTHGETGKKWLEQLPAHLNLLSQQWNFHFIKPLDDLSYNFVALVELNTNGEIVILKTAPTTGSLIPEARWLQCFHRATPRVFNLDEVQNAFIMERLTPGETLKSLVKLGDEAATRILCEAILALHSEDPKPLTTAVALSSASFSYKHITELSESLSFLKGHVPHKMISKAQTLFHDLSFDRKNDVLLHGDLHHDNILKSGTTWKVIDPHGYIGDPAAEGSPLMYNPLNSFPNDQKTIQQLTDRRLKIFYEMLPFDPQRIKAWSFCWTLLSAAWDVEGFGEILNNKIEIAHSIEQVT